MGPSIAVGPSVAMGEATYGLVELDGILLALSLDALREVVPLPATLASLPAAAPGFLGAMDLRGLVVPVLDLAVLLGTARRSGDDGRVGVVAVVVQDGRVLGLVADQVRGVTVVPDEALQPMGSPDASLVFRSTFRHPDGGDVVTVLDLDAVLALPGMPTASVRTADSLTSRNTAGNGTQAAGGPGGRRVPTTWLRCGAHHFAVAAVDIVAVLPPTVPRPSPLQGPLCTGVTDYRDTEIATVDLLRLLDLGSLPTDEPSPCVLLRPGDDGYVALTVSQVVDVLDLPLAEALPLPPGSSGRIEFLRGALPREGESPLLVLDAASLRAQPDLGALARLNRRQRGGSEAVEGVRDGARTATAASTYLTYTVGRRAITVGTPLGQVREIVPYPPQASRGMFVHRGTAVPLAVLADLLGEDLPVDPARDVVLLVESDDATVGFVVTTLQDIESATWFEEASGRTLPPDATSGRTRLSRTSLVRVTRPGAGDRLVPDLDLVALARSVHA